MTTYTNDAHPPRGYTSPATGEGANKPDPFRGSHHLMWGDPPGRPLPPPPPRDRIALTRGGSVENPEGGLYRHTSVKWGADLLHTNAGAGLPTPRERRPNSGGEKKETCGMSLRGSRESPGVNAAKDTRGLIAVSSHGSCVRHLSRTLHEKALMKTRPRSGSTSPTLASVGPTPRFQ